MHWRRRHTALVIGWVAFTLGGQLAIGGLGDPVAAAGAVAGALLVASVVVYVLGSGWQWAVGRVRAR